MTIQKLDMTIDSQTFFTFDDARRYALFIIGEMHLKVTKESYSPELDLILTCGVGRTVTVAK